MLALSWYPLPVRTFVAGVLVASYGWTVAYSLMLDGSHLRMMGAEAEKWTSAELRKTSGWTVVDAVEFAARDIDHVAVGPAHVLAVETKWTSRPVKVSERGLEGMWCDALHHAERAAERTRQLLSSQGLRSQVTPVLVLWGPGVPSIDGGYQRIGDVRVLVGKQAGEWRQRLDKLPGWSQSTAGVVPAIESYVARFEAHSERESPRVRRRWFQPA